MGYFNQKNRGDFGEVNENKDQNTFQPKVNSELFNVYVYNEDLKYYKSFEQAIKLFEANTIVKNLCDHLYFEEKHEPLKGSYIYLVNEKTIVENKEKIKLHKGQELMGLHKPNFNQKKSVILIKGNFTSIEKYKEPREKIDAHNSFYYKYPNKDGTGIPINMIRPDYGIGTFVYKKAPLNGTNNISDDNTYYLDALNDDENNKINKKIFYLFTKDNQEKKFTVDFSFGRIHYLHTLIHELVHLVYHRLDLDDKELDDIGLHCDIYSGYNQAEILSFYDAFLIEIKKIEFNKKDFTVLIKENISKLYFLLVYATSLQFNNENNMNFRYLTLYYNIEETPDISSHEYFDYGKEKFDSNFFFFLYLNKVLYNYNNSSKVVFLKCRKQTKIKNIINTTDVDPQETNKIINDYYDDKKSIYTKLLFRVN